ncbi:hypothetical protein KI387_031175, partial [Taxus chinensis]
MTVVMNTVAACVLGLLFTCSAVSSKYAQLEDHGHRDVRPDAHSHYNTLAMENTVIDSQYKSQSYHVDDYNGLGFTKRSVTPTRPKGTARKLAFMSKARNEEEQRAEKKNKYSPDSAIRNGGQSTKNAINKTKASKKIKHRLSSSSGIQTSLSPPQENKLVSSWDQMNKFKFQKKTKRTPLASTVRSLGDSSEPQSPMQEPPSTKEATKEYEPAFEGAKTSSKGHDSQTFSTSRSTTYRSDEADLSDIIGMDYGRVRRKPPIHNSSSP